MKTSVKTQDSILKLIDTDKYISIADIANNLKKSTRAIEMQISNLKKNGKLKRLGPAKGGYWQIQDGADV